MSSIYRNQSGDGSWSEFFGDVYSGTMVGIGHPKWYIQKTIGRGWDAITSLTQPSSTPSLGINTEDPSSTQGLKVVGVGYGRTGTYSLAMALDELGFPTLVSVHLRFVACLHLILF